MVDDFEVEPVFEDRTYERHQFKLKLDGNEYKGNYHDGDIHWLHPHPKQAVGDKLLKAVENKVHELLDEHGVKEEMDDLEVKQMFDHTNDVHEFKLKIHGEEYKGMFRNDQIEWFHPKPQQKIEDEYVEQVEEKIYEKIKEHLE